jgi:2-phosphosulfolactate phosphatase
MRVVIDSLLAGARRARGHTVLIDVFTSTTLVATLLARGARQVIPVLSAKRAREIKAREPAALLFGERWGKKLPGFEHNTSAVRASALDVADRKVVLTTTNGTLGMLSAARAQRLFLGSFRNAAALVEKLGGASEVTLVPIGLAHGRLRAIEDELCAELLRRYLRGREDGFAALERRVRQDLYSRLRNIGRRADVDFCLRLNAVDVVPELRGEVILAAE